MLTISQESYSTIVESFKVVMKAVDELGMGVMFRNILNPYTESGQILVWKAMEQVVAVLWRIII